MKSAVIMQGNDLKAVYPDNRTEYGNGKSPDARRNGQGPAPPPDAGQSSHDPSTPHERQSRSTDNMLNMS